MAMATMAAHGFMTVEQVCEFLAVSRARVNALIDDRDLPVVKRGPRTRLIPRRAVVELAEKWLSEAR
jgi:excisionase family DNA binding protein